MEARFRVLLLAGFLTAYWWLILLVLAAISAGVALWLGHQRQLEAAGRRSRNTASNHPRRLCICSTGHHVRVERQAQDAAHEVGLHEFRIAGDEVGHLTV
jgi:hypothetical protein